MLRILLTASLAALPCALLACGDDAAPRRLGAVCSANGQCESGVCGGGVCITPDGDDDLDGIINIREAQLSMDPVSVDSDGDGKLDADEIGTDPTNPPDWEGDGKVDAAESAIHDVDNDCIPDERDALDSKVESSLTVIAEVACCCDGRCSEVAREVTVEAHCEVASGSVDVISCEDDADCPEGYTCSAEGTCHAGDGGAGSACGVGGGGEDPCPAGSFCNEEGVCQASSDRPDQGFAPLDSGVPVQQQDARTLTCSADGEVRLFPCGGSTGTPDGDGCDCSGRQCGIFGDCNCGTCESGFVCNEGGQCEAGF